MSFNGIDSPDEPLPPGWFRKVDDYGRNFYVNTQNGKSYWRKPVEVQGGLVICSETERREFFRGIYDEVLRRFRQVRGRASGSGLPSFIDLYKLANSKQIPENSFGTFLRGYISSTEKEGRPRSSKKGERKTRSAPSPARRRLTNATLARRASEDAMEYARKKREQKERANRKRMGHSWTNDRDSSSAHKPTHTPRSRKSHVHKATHSARSTRSARSHGRSAAGAGRRRGAHFPPGQSMAQSNANGVPRRNSRGDPYSKGDIRAPESPFSDGEPRLPRAENSLSLSQRSSHREHPNHGANPTLLKVVMSRTDEEREKSVALRNAIQNVSPDGRLLSNRASPAANASAVQSSTFNRSGGKLGLGELLSSPGNSTSSRVGPLPAHSNKVIRKQIIDIHKTIQRLEAAEHASATVNMSETNMMRLTKAQNVIAAKVDTEFALLRRALNLHVHDARSTIQRESSTEGSRNVSLQDAAATMTKDLEIESLKRANDALRERLKTAMFSQEKLRDSEATLKRQLLASRADMAKLEADAAGEVAAHTALASQLRDLRFSSDSLLAERSATIRNMKEKNVMLQNTAQELREELESVAPVREEHRMAIAGSVSSDGSNDAKTIQKLAKRIAKMEDEKRLLFAKLQAKDAEIDASKASRERLRRAIDAEAMAKQETKSLEAENKKLQSRLNGAFERLNAMEESSAQAIEDIQFNSNSDYDVAIDQVRNLETKLRTSLTTTNELQREYGRLSRDNETLAQKIIALETENVELERNRSATANRLKQASMGRLNEALIEQMEADNKRKLEKLRRQVHEEAAAAQKMTIERAVSKYEKELERLRTDSEIELHDLKKQLLNEMHRQQKDHESQVKEQKAVLESKSLEYAKNLEEAKSKAIADLECEHTRHESELSVFITEKTKETERQIESLESAHDEVLSKATTNLAKMFEQRLDETEMKCRTSVMRARRGAAAKMIFMLLNQAGRFRRIFAFKLWFQNSRILSLESTERDAWKYCQQTSGAQHIKALLSNSANRSRTRLWGRWKQQTLSRARHERAHHDVATGVAIQRFTGFAKVQRHIALTTAFFRLKWHWIEEDCQYKMKVVSQRALDRQEVQGLQFKQLYTENSALRRQVTAMGRQVQDLTTKAELWRRRCISTAK